MSRSVGFFAGTDAAPLATRRAILATLERLARPADRRELQALLFPDETRDHVRARWTSVALVHLMDAGCLQRDNFRRYTPTDRGRLWLESAEVFTGEAS